MGICLARRPFMATRTRRRWSARVMRTSDALDLEHGVFTKRSPRAVARSLKRSAERSSRRKSAPFRSAMSMLNFHINRGGKNLSASQRKVLEGAKGELRKLYGRKGRRRIRPQRNRGSAQRRARRPQREAGDRHRPFESAPRWRAGRPQRRQGPQGRRSPHPRPARFRAMPARLPARSGPDRSRGGGRPPRAICARHRRRAIAQRRRRRT